MRSLARVRVSAVRPALLSLLLGACLLAGSPARAGLFDDEEARKAIVDLRQRMSQAEEQFRAEAVARAQLSEQLGALRGSLLDLNNQLETLRRELATLRGSNEQLTRDVAELQKGQKDIAGALDTRLRALEPARVTLDGREFEATPEERHAYEQALATLRTGDFEKSAAELTNFQRKYPKSGYTDSVRFWLGNALYGKRDYREAVAAFRAFVSGAPTHPRAPEAMLAMANSQAEMKDPRSARRTIEDLLKAYPASEAAQAGKERLASLK